MTGSTPTAAAMTSTAALTVIGSPPPMLYTSPTAPPSRARTVPSMQSDTKVFARDCSPSPWITIGLPVKHGLDEAVVGHVRSLTRAVDREVADDRGRQIEGLNVSRHEVLGGQLADSVRRRRTQGTVLVADRVEPVDRGGGNLHKALHPGTPGGLEEATEPDDVAADVELEVRPARGEPGHRGLVDDGVDAVEHRVEIRDPKVGLDEAVLRRSQRGLEVTTLDLLVVEANEGIETGHGVSIGQQALGQPGADEPRRSGDQDAHG